MVWSADREEVEVVRICPSLFQQGFWYLAGPLTVTEMEEQEV